MTGKRRYEIQPHAVQSCPALHAAGLRLVPWEAEQVNEFIERLSTALYEALDYAVPLQMIDRGVRAVLVAMEQPSQKMIDAAHALDDPGCPNDGDFGHVATIEEHWRAMITAAAKESSD